MRARKSDKAKATKTLVQNYLAQLSNISNLFKGINQTEAGRYLKDPVPLGVEQVLKPRCPNLVSYYYRFQK